MSLFKKKNEKLEVELSEKNIWLRLALVVVFLLIGVSAIAYFISSLVSEDAGWQTIDLTDDNFPILRDDFVLTYNIGQSDVSVSKEKKSISRVYTESMVKAYKIFDINEEYDGVINLYTLNRNPNKVFEVSDTLYDAFKLLENSESRMLYLAPICAEYRNVFISENDTIAALSDPNVSDEALEYVSEMLIYTNDPNMIDLELLGDNRVCLKVSEEYLSYAEENEIESFIEFSWLTNALIIDYTADALVKEGFLNGSISSFDGYLRILDEKNSYNYNVYDLLENSIYNVAVVSFKGVKSTVFFKSYPLNSKDNICYYSYSDGKFINRYIDYKTGLCKNSLKNVISYSYEAGCAETAIKLSQAFISENFDVNTVKGLTDQEIYSIWTDSKTVVYNDVNLEIIKLFTSDDVMFKSELFK